MPTDAPTWTRDVAPLLDAQCRGCHAAGGLAPLPLDTYEDAARYAAQIAAATAARTMPPFGVDSSGACQTYDDARWLSDAQISTLGRWAELGAPRGDGEPLRAAGLTGRPPIRADATLDMGAEYLPDSTAPDDYRCFVVNPGLVTSRYLTGFAVHPGEPRIVHHIIAFALASEDAEAEAEALDDVHPGLGYPCFGGPGVNDIRFVAGWAPGARETHYPERTGIELTAGRKVVLQVHYHSAGASLADRTRIELQLEDSVELPAIVLPLADLELALDPGQTAAKATVEAVLSEPPAVDLYGVFPHMHRLGRSLRVERIEGEVAECLADVPAWRFDWQQFYFYDAPIHVAVGDRVRLTCTFDTRGRTEPTHWGEGTEDEMCLAGFYLVRR